MLIVVAETFWNITAKKQLAKRNYNAMTATDDFSAACPHEIRLYQYENWGLLGCCSNLSKCIAFCLHTHVHKP